MVDNMEKMLSIVIPYHNNPQGIKLLLKSLQAYDDACVEVIIVNDNSDSIVDLLSDFSNLDIRYLELPENRTTAGAARNVGLMAAKGKFIVFADDDDVFISNSFELMKSIFSCEEDIVYFPVISETSDGDKSIRHKRYNYLIMDALSGGKLIKYHYHPPWGKVYSRTFLNTFDIRFEEISYSNDVLFSLKASTLARNYKIMTQAYYCVIDRKNSLTKQISEKSLDIRFHAALRCNSFLKSINDEYYLSMFPHIKKAFAYSFTKGMKRLYDCFKNDAKVFYPRYLTNRWFKNKWNKNESRFG